MTYMVHVVQLEAWNLLSLVGGRQIDIALQQDTRGGSSVVNWSILPKGTQLVWMGIMRKLHEGLRKMLGTRMWQSRPKDQRLCHHCC